MSSSPPPRPSSSASKRYSESIAASERSENDQLESLNTNTTAGAASAATTTTLEEKRLPSPPPPSPPAIEINNFPDDDETDRGTFVSRTSRKSVDYEFVDYKANENGQPTRNDLNRALGEDMNAHTLEISTFPCAGLRISQGPLASLIGWRFVVHPDEASDAFRSTPKPGTIVNFILDTGAPRSVVPLETFRALHLAAGGTGEPRWVPRVGSEVMLLVQGIRTKMVVGRPGEMGRLSGQYLFANDLTLYFDTRLDAPVLYVTDIEHKTVLSPMDIPRTVARALSFRVFSMFTTRQKSSDKLNHRSSHRPCSKNDKEKESDRMSVRSVQW